MVVVVFGGKLTDFCNGLRRGWSLVDLHVIVVLQDAGPFCSGSPTAHACDSEPGRRSLNAL